MFINRIKEVEFLKSDYAHFRERSSKFLLISAPSGFGKSMLVNRSFLDNDRFLRVKMPKHRKSQQISSIYVKELGRTLHEYAISHGKDFTFKDHLDSNISAFGSSGNLKAKSGENEITARNSKSFLNRKRDTLEVAFSSDYSTESAEVSRYIRWTLSKGGFIVALENIQNIDSESLAFFRQVLSLHNNIYLIGEYTDGIDNDITAVDLIDYFKGPYTISENIKLDRLPLDEILLVCKSKPDLISRLLESTYESSSGNLHNLQILFSDNLRPKRIEDLKIPFGLILRDTISSLSAQESMLLASVVAHGGRVDSEIFNSFFKKIKTSRTKEFLFLNTSDLIRNLEKKQLIKISKNHFETAQDSVIEESIKLPQLQKYLLINYRNWLSFYQNLKGIEKEQLIPVSEIIAMEIFFMAMLEDYSGIRELLDELYQLALKSIAPKRAISYLELILENLDKKKPAQWKYLKRVIATAIVRILYRFWHFEEILKYAEEFIDDSFVFAFYGTALALTGAQAKAIEICNKSLQQNEHVEIALFIRIIAYRSSNRYEECEREWRYHYENETFKDSPLEQMFMRCSDLAILSNPEERFNILKQVVSNYPNNPNPLEEISARNAMGTQFGYSGMLDEAREEFRKAKIQADNILSRHYALENNLSVLDVHRGEITELTIERLEAAAAICETKLDQFIVWINIMVIYSSLRTVAEIEAVIRSIEQRIFNKEVDDYDLIRIAYFNISVYYNSTDEKDLCEYFRTKAIELPLLVDHQFWNAKLKGIEVGNDLDDFRLKLDYYPVYINYWHFDFDSVLGNWSKLNQ